MVAQIDRAYALTCGWRTARRVVSYGLFEGRPATTRGQLINPLVQAHLKLAAATGARRPPDRPIFILGVGRSGTTHLGRILSTHPLVGFLNEPKAMWHVVDRHEDVSGFYNREKGSFTYSRGDATEELQHRAWAVYNYYARATGAKRVVDKYPELTYRRDFLKALFPGAILIAIVREPAAVIESITRWNATHALGSEDWWGVGDSKWLRLTDQFVVADELLSAAVRSESLPHPAQRALVEWVVGMRALTTHIPGAAPDLILRYEDLAERPRESVTNVLNTSGLPVSRAVLDFAESQTNPAERPHSADFGLLDEEVQRLRSALGYA